MKKTFFIIIVLCLFSIKPVFSQIGVNRNTFYKNSIFCELIGHSRSLLSVNYEKISNLYENVFFYTSRLGIGYTPGLKIKSEKHSGTISVPAVLSLLVGKKNSYAQLGVGYAASFGQDFVDSTSTPPSIYQKFESSYTISIGYRYMDSNGLVAQIYPLLQWTNNSSSKFNVGFGLSIGVAF